jgi:hypothetical protein
MLKREAARAPRWAGTGAAMFVATALTACSSSTNYPPLPPAVDAGNDCRAHCTSLCFANCECAFQVSSGGYGGGCVDNCTGDPSLCVVETDAGSDATTVDAPTEASLGSGATEDATGGARDAAPK